MARILIIDDEQDIRVLLRDLFKGAGYEVEIAANGKEAMDFCKDKQVDLMITDIIMPEMEGVETIGNFVKMFPEIKIIAISGGGKIHPEAYLETVRNFFPAVKQTFMKPFKGGEILQAVQRLIGS
ncbi:MAG TPA: response regulator [Candidatus Omnitrophota bacterium]|nr:response regulator [Candidatus Omnitrophota bacterium]HSA30639.1 response regulator [Candidatus Omnitrophota bacterium]